MRKVFVVLMALSLGGLMVACSEDDTTIWPTPQPDPDPEFEISTTEIAVGYTCAPYAAMLEATGGTAPYTWALDEGSSLPDGVTLSTDGRIHGLLEIEGSWSFTVVCTDASETPNSAEVELTLDVEVTSNPSIALFYDSEAMICASETMAFSAIDCYVFVMLQDGTPDCSYGAEFMITIEDENGNLLEAGEAFYHTYISYSPDVVLSMGNPFSGVAVAFSRPMYGAYGDIHVLTFGLVLEENFDNMSIKVGPSPSSGRERPIIATCVGDREEVEVNGRVSALNYVIE